MLGCLRIKDQKPTNKKIKIIHNANASMIQEFKDMSVAYNSVFYFLYMYRLEENFIYFYTLFHVVSVSVDHLAFVCYHDYSSMKIKT